MGSFSLEIDDIFHLDEYIKQHVLKRDSSQLASIQIELSFTDGDTMIFNSIEQLNTISTKITNSKSICISVDIKWNFLVKFSDENVPLLQKISVSFNTSNPPDYILEQYELDESYFFGWRKGYIDIVIDHNNLTWANPLISILSTYLENFFYDKESGFRKFFRKNLKTIQHSLVGVSFLVYIVLIIASFNNLRNYLLQLETNIKSLIDISVNGYWSIYLLGTFIFSIVYIFSLVFLYTQFIKMLSFKKPSWILLSDGSENSKMEYEAKHKNNIWFNIVKIVFSISLNIFASWLYTVISAFKLI